MGNREYQLVIVGGGLAGMTAALYATRSGLKTLLLERLMTGGQIINADTIENFPGFPDGISGADLTILVQDQATKYGLDLELDEVATIQQNPPGLSIETQNGNIFDSLAVIIASGSSLKHLGIPGEEENHGTGVSYCATCDGAFFKDQVVGVVGGGDSALDEAITLTEFASKVFLIHKGKEFVGQRLLQDRVKANPQIEIISQTIIESINGNSGVEAVTINNTQSGERSILSLQGLFIYIGLSPNTQYLRDLLPLDTAGHIPTDLLMRTPVRGVLAAGDIRQHSAAQLISSAGDGATAAISAQRYIDRQEWTQ
jgi:thioredoxin reductase (NADPH)